MNGWNLRENWALYLVVALPALLGGGIVVAVAFAIGWLVRGNQ